MIKCKVAKPSETDCGTDQCCKTCDKRFNCATACEEVFDPSSEYCDEAFEEEAETDLQVMESAIPDTLEKITEITIQIDKLKKQEEMFRQRVLEAMETFGIKKFENNKVRFTYVAPTTRTSLDSSKVKKLHPEIVEECSKTSEVSSSVRITVK